MKSAKSAAAASGKSPSPKSVPGKSAKSDKSGIAVQADQKSNSGGKSLPLAKESPQGGAQVSCKTVDRKVAEKRPICPVPTSSKGDKSGREKRAVPSPTSIIGSRGPQGQVCAPTSHVSISAVTDSSVLGKVRVPTLIVNPADIPTTRCSDKSWTNVTIGGRRRPSAAEQQEQAIKQQMRSLRAIFIASISSVAFLVVVLIVGLVLLFTLSESAQSTDHSSTVATSRRHGYE